jgi:hypothetical protein
MGRKIRRVPPNWKHPEEWRWQTVTPWVVGHYDLALDELECLNRIRGVGPFWQEVKLRSFVPMFDESIEEAQDEWDAYRVDHTEEETTDRHGRRPDAHAPRGYDEETGHGPEVYRPNWTDAERTAYQVYETVSEGTPVSSVFPTVDDLRAWLIEQGHSEAAADKFIEWGSVPSMVVAGGQVFSNIDAAGIPDA